MGTPSLPPPQETLVDRYAKLIFQFGVPTVLAGVLLWFIMVRLLAALDVMRTDLDTQTKLLEHIEAQVEQCKKGP